MEARYRPCIHQKRSRDILRIGDLYEMDGRPGWKIAYYPLLEDGKTGEPYKEARALVERPAVFDGEKGTDFREVPLRYLKRIQLLSLSRSRKRQKISNCG